MAPPELEKFWTGPFGDKYTARNVGNIRNNFMFFKRILYTQAAWDGKSIVEFGAGSGENLRALRELLPKSHQTAVEINKVALTTLKATLSQPHTIIDKSVLDPKLNVTADLAITKGLLIHIDPLELHKAYETIYRSATSHILIAEYYNPTPIEVPYRGHVGKLFKRDFAGEMMDKYKDLRLVDYGWTYHCDAYPQDDISWFLMRKT